MALNIDNDRKTRYNQHVDEELVIWLTTVSADGTPQPNPVWFVPDGDDIIVYSNHKAARNHNIARNPHVSLNFNTDPHDEHVMVITGTAQVDTSLPPSDQSAAYMAKYGEYIPGLNLTPRTYAEAFSVALRITPRKIRD